MQPSDKKTAQQRVDDIQAFQRELERLQAAGVVEMKVDAMDAVREYHSAQIQFLKNSFDIDADSRARQLSTGMRIASFLGAAALSAGIFFFFHQIWGFLTAPVQMLVLSGFSLASLVLTFVLQSRGYSPYFVQLTGIIAFAAFVLNIVMPGQIYNLYPTPYALLLTGIYGFMLAYRFRLKWILVAAIALSAAFISAVVVMLTGAPWTSANERPENLLAIGILCFSIPWLIPQQRFPEFSAVYRVCGLLIIFIPVIFLGFWGEMTYLLIAREHVEVIYQIFGFVGTLIAAAFAIRKQWLETTHTAMVLFAVFFYIKLFDWFWDFFPKYLFFFIVGLTALMFLVVLKKMRNRIYPQSGGAG